MEAYQSLGDLRSALPFRDLTHPKA